MTSRHLLFAICASLFACSAAAQPQWRFHLAFEDGTGARDTIWFIWDTTATMGLDTHLGQGSVQMDMDVFNVWMYNPASDSTKTLAYPYSSFPWHGEQEIHGFNYQYPITIRWDRSLFQAEYLPNPDTINTAVMNGQYFYWYGNMPFPGVHSLLEEDSVVVLDLGDHHHGHPRARYGSAEHEPSERLVASNSARWPHQGNVRAGPFWTDRPCLRINRIRRSRCLAHLADWTLHRSCPDFLQHLASWQIHQGGSLRSLSEFACFESE
jgi:hypothetical protein